MAFWRTWSWDASAIDSLLDSEDVSLEQLLNENDILTEAKAQNKKLIDFITKEQNLFQFVSYVTDEHPELTEETKFKYPYIICEILCTDIQALYEAIFQNKELLDKIFDFWMQPAPLNHLLAGYVNRITGCFLAKRKTEVINYLKEKEDFLGASLKQLEETNVVDLLLKLIACDEIEVPTISWLAENNLIPKILEKYDTAMSPVIHENVSQLLSGIIVISAQNISAGGDCRLLRELENEDTVEALFKRVFADAKSSALFYGSSVVVELVRQSTSELFDFETPLEEIPPIIRILAEHAGTMNDFLQIVPTEEVRTTFGTLSPPLGSHRLKVIEMLGMLVNARFVSAYLTLLETPVLSTLISLFFQYHWNNFLHSIVNRIFTVILESNDSEAVLKCFEQTQLHTKLAAVGLEDINSFENESYQRRGYMGFVTSLTGVIQLATQVNEDLAQELAENEDWQKYLHGVYTQTQEIQNKALGGVAGAESSEEEEPDQMIQFQHIVKRDFENEFPGNFAVGDFEDKGVNDLVHPPSDQSFVGILCEEPGFGDEFDD